MKLKDSCVKEKSEKNYPIKQAQFPNPVALKAPATRSLWWIEAAQMQTSGKLKLGRNAGICQLPIEIRNQCDLAVSGLHDSGCMSHGSAGVIERITTKFSYIHGAPLAIYTSGVILFHCLVRQRDIFFPFILQTPVAGRVNSPRIGCAWGYTYDNHQTTTP